MARIEQAETPQVCSECIPARHVRLVRDSAGSECRICFKPFVTFRWRLGNATKRTLICESCAASNQACQSCVLDIEFHISLELRDATLRIMAEEGGTEEDRSDVLRAIAAEFKVDDVQPQAEPRSSELSSVVSRFPLPGTRPEGCKTLCAYGIEADLDVDALRSYFRTPIDRVEYVPHGRYAFFTFSGDAFPEAEAVIIDGRRLVFAWGDRVAVPPSLQPSIGAVVRAFLRTSMAQTDPQNDAPTNSRAGGEPKGPEGHQEERSAEHPEEQTGENPEEPSEEPS